MPPIIYRGGVKWEHWKEDVKRFLGGLHNLQRKLMELITEINYSIDRSLRHEKELSTGKPKNVGLTLLAFEILHG